MMEAEGALIERSVRSIMMKFESSDGIHQPLLKELKRTVQKLGDQIIPSLVDILFVHLRRDNSLYRLAILNLVNYFFQRSHHFRTHLVDLFQDFLIYTLEIDPLHYPLPKEPKEMTVRLKSDALVIVRSWIEKFGPGYFKLANAEFFLQTSKHFDFERCNSEILVERSRLEQEKMHRDDQERKKCENVSMALNEQRADIENSLVEADNILQIIIPKFSHFLTSKQSYVDEHNAQCNSSKIVTDVCFSC